MRAWTIDADDIHEPADFDDRLLHRTPRIDDFLDHTRDDKFILIGTKGFGKTLLLKAKRISYQEEQRLCLPANGLLDTPIGDKDFSRDLLAVYATGTDAWTKAWRMAIAAAVLKHLGATDGLRVHHRLLELLGDENLRTVLDHFCSLLDLPPSDFFKCAGDADTHLLPRLRAVSTPVAVFIDGVDEYFNKHVKVLSEASSATGALSPEVWYYSQMGLVEAAYQLRRSSHHVKVFAAVRKEAFQRFSDTTSMVQQYSGTAVDLSYSKESLRQIFLNNVRREKKNNLVAPELVESRPLEAFFGRATIRHTYTGEDEEVFDYVYRHTLLRPRDLMTIGRRVSEIAPAQRRDVDRIKVAVNAGATEIANEYLAEIAPYLGPIDLPALLASLPSHVMSRGEVEGLFAAHSAAGGSPVHVFCMLYRTGLLGHVHEDRVTGKCLQRFLAPGEGTFDPDGTLPTADYYLVHPVLSGVVSKRNPEYATRIDRRNVVGNGRPWRDPARPQGEALCLLKGDVVGFRMLLDDGRDLEVRDALRAAVERHARGCRSWEVVEGDAITVACDDAAELVKVAHRIREDVGSVRGVPRLRLALDRGEVTLRSAADGAARVETGTAVIVAARVLPHVAPGEVWATAAFREALEATNTVYRAVPVEVPSGGNAVNVKKPAERDDLIVRLYRIA